MTQGTTRAAQRPLLRRARDLAANGVKPISLPLPAQIAHAKAHAPAYARLLADIDPSEITSRAALARLPVVL